MRHPTPRSLRQARPGVWPRRLSTGGFTLMEMVVVVVILAALAALVVSNVDNIRDDAETTVAISTLHTLREAIVGSPAAPGYLADMKYTPGFSVVNLRTHDLLSGSRYPAFSIFDPVEKRGWRGPYLRNTQGVANWNTLRNGLFPASHESRFDGDRTFQERGFFNGSTSPYGETGDLTAADPWGNPIVIQVPPKSAFSGPADEAKRFQFARLVSAGSDGVLSTPLDRLAGMETDGAKTVRGDDLVLFLNRADVYEAE